MQEVRVWSLGRELRSHVPQDVAKKNTKKQKNKKPASQFFLMGDNRHKKKLWGHWWHLKMMSKMNCSLSLVISPGLPFPTSSIHFSLCLSLPALFLPRISGKEDRCFPCLRVGGNLLALALNDNLWHVLPSIPLLYTLWTHHVSLHIQHLSCSPGFSHAGL